jgi:hypothetical protein
VAAGSPGRHGYHYINPAAGMEAVFTYSPTTGAIELQIIIKLSRDNYN